jgi:hypothetical protein
VLLRLLDQSLSRPSSRATPAATIASGSAGRGHAHVIVGTLWGRCADRWRRGARVHAAAERRTGSSASRQRRATEPEQPDDVVDDPLVGERLVRRRKRHPK